MCTGLAANCNAVEDRLQRAREVQSGMKAGGDKDKLGAVLQLYGKTGVANGVNVSFSSKTDVGSAKMEEDGSISVSLNTSFSKFGTGYSAPRDVGAAMLVHEGQHGVDERAAGRNPRNRAEEMATERNAYNTESFFQRAAGTQSFHGLWDPAWRASEAEANRRAAVERYAEYSTEKWCASGGNCGP